MIQYATKAWSLAREHSENNLYLLFSANSNLDSHRYPIHPYLRKGCGRLNVAFPSGRHKNAVAFYHQIESTNDSQKRMIYPTGCTAIVFRCDPDKPEIFLVGTPTKPREAEYARTGCIYLVAFFYPGLSYSYFPIPAKELADRALPISEILFKESKVIKELLTKARCFQERINIIEDLLDRLFLLNKKYAKTILPVLKDICSSIEVFSCIEMGKRTGYTDRHIRRLFDTYIGVSPLFFRRIIRYQNALRILNVQPKQNMAKLAVDLGYFDQSHFIKEFKKLQGVTPMSFSQAISKISFV